MAKKWGFTLVELMVVMAVIAILALISLFSLRNVSKSARDSQRQQIMGGLRTVTQRYLGDMGGYPVGNFSQAMSSLSTDGLLSVKPVDPGCGAGKATYPSPLVGAAGNWLPCGAGGGVTYSYNSNGNVYTYGLYKEGGGLNLFLSPQ